MSVIKEFISRIKDVENPKFHVFQSEFSEEELEKWSTEGVFKTLNAFNEDYDVLLKTVDSLELNNCFDFDGFFNEYANCRSEFTLKLYKHRVYQQNIEKSVGMPFLLKLDEILTSNEASELFNKISFSLKEDTFVGVKPVNSLKFKSEYSIKIIEFALRSFFKENRKYFNVDLLENLETQGVDQSSDFLKFIYEQEDPIGFLQSVSSIYSLSDDLEKISSGNSQYFNVKTRELKETLNDIACSLLKVIRKYCGKNHKFLASKYERLIIVNLFESLDLFNLYYGISFLSSTGNNDLLSAEKKDKFIDNRLHRK